MVVNHVRACHNQGNDRSELQAMTFATSSVPMHNFQTFGSVTLQPDDACLAYAAMMPHADTIVRNGVRP